MKAEKSLIEELCSSKSRNKFLHFLKYNLQDKEFNAYSLTLPDTSLVQRIILSGRDLVLVKLGREHKGEQVIANDYGRSFRGEEYVYGSGDEIWKSPVLELYTARLAVEHVAKALSIEISRCMCIYLTQEKIINTVEQSHFWEMCGVKVFSFHCKHSVNNRVGECRSLEQVEPDIESWIEATMKKPVYELNAMTFFDETRYAIRHSYFCLERSEAIDAEWDKIKSRHAQKQESEVVNKPEPVVEVKPVPDSPSLPKRPIYREQEIEFPADEEPLEEVPKDYMSDTSENVFEELLKTMSKNGPKFSCAIPQNEETPEEAVLKEPVNVDFDAESEAFVEREFMEQVEVEEEPKMSEAKESSTFGRYLRHFGEKVLKRIMPDETGMV